MASHDRKRMRFSRTEANLTSSSADMAATTTPASGSASTSAKNMAANRSSAPRAPNPAELALTSLNTDIEAMRQLVTCKICDRLLYEPYSLACGHTYCYSCLSQWLVSNHKKTCPDCRATITQQPTPTYIIRELVLIFINRNELLPTGETSDEHHTLAKDEGKIVTDDRNNTDPVTGGLFKGCFKRRAPHLQPLRDAGDGVDRCPACAWELEDGECLHCGYTVDELDVHGDWSDDSDHDAVEDVSDAGHADYFGYDDFDGDDEIDSDDELTQAVMNSIHGRPANLGPRYISSDEEFSDEEHEHDMDGFIVRDDEVVEEDDGSDTDVPEVVRSHRIRHRRAPGVISDDEDEGTEVSTAAEPHSDEDSEDEGPVVHGSQRNKRGHLAVRARRARMISSDEDDDTSDATEEHDVETRGYGGFSPLDGSAGQASSTRSEDGSDQSSSVHAYNPYVSEQEGHDEDSEESEGGYGHGGGEDDGWGPLRLMYDTRGTSLTPSTGTRAETPGVRRSFPHQSSHRLGALGQHSTRHASPPAYGQRYRWRRGPRIADQYRSSPDVTTNATHNDRERYGEPRQDTFPRSPLRHPFHLGNTLASVNYNQRSQNTRNHRSDRATVGGSSQSSNGGVDVRSAGSSGSSSTVRAQVGASSRRKRALSIASDDEYEVFTRGTY